MEWEQLSDGMLSLTSLVPEDFANQEKRSWTNSITYRIDFRPCHHKDFIYNTVIDCALSLKIFSTYQTQKNNYLA